MKKNHKRERKTLFVNRKVQGRFLIRLSLYWCVYHVVLLHTMFLFRYLEYKASHMAGGAAVSFSQLYGSFLTQNYSLILCSAVVFPVVLWDMIKATHRVVGPLVRFQNSLARLANGEPVCPIKLRDGDLLVEFQDTFNLYLDRLPRPAKNEPDSNRGPCDVTQDDETESSPEFDAPLSDLREIQHAVAAAGVGHASAGEPGDAV